MSSYYHTRKVAGLKNYLRIYGLPVTGKKEDLIARLENREREDAEKYRKESEIRDRQEKEEREREKKELEATTEAPDWYRRRVIDAVFHIYKEDLSLYSIRFIYDREPFSYTTTILFLRYLTDDSLTRLANKSPYINDFILNDQFWKLIISKVYNIRNISQPTGLAVRSYKSFWKISRPVIYVVIDKGLTSALPIAFRSMNDIKYISPNDSQFVVDIHLRSDSFDGLINNAHIALLSSGDVVAFIGESLCCCENQNPEDNFILKLVSLSLESPGFLIYGVDDEETIKTTLKNNERIELSPVVGNQ